MTISASELWRSDRADEIREEHPTVSEADATDRAEAESRAGLDPYRPECRTPEVGEPGALLEAFDDWVRWR